MEANKDNVKTSIKCCKSEQQQKIEAIDYAELKGEVTSAKRKQKSK
jgi:hypothetical protein